MATYRQSNMKGDTMKSSMVSTEMGAIHIDLMSELNAKVLNTNLRSKTWMQADRHLSGKFSTVPKNKKSGCDFDPDAMPN